MPDKEPSILDYATPRQGPRLMEFCMIGLAGVVGFIVAGFATFRVLMFLFDLFNLTPREERLEGYGTAVFGITIAVPLGIIAGAVGAWWSGKRMKRNLIRQTQDNDVGSKSSNSPLPQ